MTPRPVLPGLGVAVAGAALAVGVHALVPALGATLVAMALGLALALTGVVDRTPALGPGLQVASRSLLRAGVALLGLQLVVGDVVALGWPVLLVVSAVVGLGILGCLALARVLGVPADAALLVAAGSSICGAAAVGAVQGVRRVRDETVATVVSLVVVLGSVAMLVLPLLADRLGLGEAAAGAWAGASVHEVGQVVVAGGLVGGAALQVAVVVKLARVLLLAPVLAVVTVLARRDRAEGAAATDRPPLVPGFVVAFAALVAVGSLVALPAPVLDGAALLQSLALSAGMVALGCSLRPAVLRATGPRVVLLGAAATVLVAALGLPAAYLV